MEQEQERETGKASTKMLEQEQAPQEQREFECKRLEVELTEMAVGNSTVAAFVVVVTAVVDTVIVEQCNSTLGYTRGNIVKNSCRDSVLENEGTGKSSCFILFCFPFLFSLGLHCLRSLKKLQSVFIVRRKQ